MKVYMGFVRDHSASMGGLGNAAQDDFNGTVVSVRKAADENNVDAIVSVVECGHGSTRGFKRVVTNSSIGRLEPITSYSTDGHATPLFDSVGDLIELFKAMPDYNDPDVTFVINATTDGEDNNSPAWRNKISAEMRNLQKDGRWTFTYRVPKGSARTLVSMGVPAGNILEWDQSQAGLSAAKQKSEAAFDSYFRGVAKGEKASSKFYTDLKDISKDDIKAVLSNVSANVRILKVKDEDDGTQIRDFVTKVTGEFTKGSAYYQLVKTEDIQESKQIMIRDKNSGVIYAGAQARDVLQLPDYGTARVAPGDNGDWVVFVQSTSVNRKVTKGTNVLLMK